MVYSKNGVKFLKSSSELDRSDFTILVERFRMFFHEKLGFELLTPEDFYQKEFIIMQELENDLKYQ